MVRLVSQLLALMALLLAPLPAVAAAPPAPSAAVTAAAEHCEETDTGASHRNGDEPQQTEKHPCCKSSMSSCCPVAVPLAGSSSPQRPQAATSSHGARSEIFVLGASTPPLTEPPTFA